MKCFKLNLTSSDYANGVHIKIQDAFEKIFISSDGSKDIAMFSSKSSVGDIPLYLVPSDNPAIEVIARAYPSESSDLPDGDSLILLVGNSDAISYLA